ncbi:MAG: valine--tRNA ligase [Candidatus Cloacimonas sp.]|nr:valine--tRNA ligase [Candidatus Cloacimonadota bacterium]
MEIGKAYEPNKIEGKWYSYWRQNGFFKPKIDQNKQPYTVLMPPPNVTGILHIGHVLNNTLQDIAIRYKRMTGVPTLWLPGMDHAGIATQNVVEKELQKQGLDRHQVGREKLVEMIWEWKEEKGGAIFKQLKQLGASCDWSRERFTMDEQLSKAVVEVFVHLYNKGLIYKGEYIINWCPRCVSALSNDEVEHSDETGSLWHIKYPFVEGDEYITVATTRPETMLGDVAVAVNPKDERYKNIIGKKLRLPFIGREIPIIADSYVEKEFGTGLVKITPAHDPNDFEMGQRHNLQPVVIMDEQGVMNDNAGEKFRGLDRFECRKKIVNELKEMELLEKVEQHSLSIGQCYRCDSVVEPYISEQWFVKMKPLAEKAIDAVESGEIQLQPERWIKVFMHWMNNIRDWCISRQIWWGHRIPAYYCENCDEMVVAIEPPKKCAKCNGEQFRQDEDVLDTWFSSWLWPFSTMGWPEETQDLDYFLPTDLLVTAPDIIYLWVARMIMSTFEFRDKIPFKTVLLHGTVRDEIGRKMSKSLGNSPDPLDIIERVGADALRFSMVFNAPKGADIHFSEAVLENGRNFCNKIWNAYRYIMTNISEIDGLPEKDQIEFELADKWIYSRLNSVTKEVTEYYESLRFNDAAQLLQDFIWREFCSWYLELSKERIYDKDNLIARQNVKFILIDVLEKSMRLLHPIMPFITEEVWQSLKQFYPLSDEALIIAEFPQVNESLIDKRVDADMEMLQEAITTIRNLRKQVNLSPGKEVDLVIRAEQPELVDTVKKYQNYFGKMAKVNDIIFITDEDKPKQAIAAVSGKMEIFLLLSGLIDVGKEKERLEKNLQKILVDLERTIKKLNNESFLANAKPEVVEKERLKETELSELKEKTEALISDLQ